ncbi:MAG: hypothetical protein GYB33_20460 [Gammaproteobacteria bacterium]|uniref:tetratricopeptide repeat protein n=1 Tax=Pseudomaricurvus alcaniphilus TaxID=1166482 RepID=UPI001407A403|nr:tetratricopeptide repeat protein [Pseudomaricurvus alcaniphilus]MBR9912720.1 hypothetical protein [Gammaproteobacteria bacterium]NHN38902.1 hypothetical protein [Pseudomaricurvus alcaniphilus]
MNRLTRLPALAAVVLVAMLVSACQSQQAQPTASPASGTERGQSGPVEAVPQGRETEAPDETGSRPPPRQRAYSAIAALEDRALEHLAQQQWQQAIESAEHGLRLDRRYATFYRVLGESYKALGDYDRAAGFARQALRFCGQNCRAAEDLVQSLGGR